MESEFSLCQNEAMASFGDNRMLLEKYVEEPRHIEIQVWRTRESARLSLCLLVVCIKCK